MSKKIRIGIARDVCDKEGQTTVPDFALNALNNMPDVECKLFPKLFPEATPEVIEGFDIFISRNVVPVWTEQSLTGNSQLIAVLRNGVGYDKINVSALSDAGVMLCITPEGVRRPMAVVILTLILALSTDLLVKDKMTRNGLWSEVSHCVGAGIAGKTLGSIGAGRIGLEMFRVAMPLGFKHVAFDPYISQEAAAEVNLKLTDMETVLAESDYLNISCLLNESTHHLIGEKELRSMKSTAFLINTARGPIVDEKALVKALREGWIQGAGIDVFEEEPTPPDNPLLKMDNVIVIGHALGLNNDMIGGIWSQIIRQVSQIIKGEIPEGLVNSQVPDTPNFQSRWSNFKK